MPLCLDIGTNLGAVNVNSPQLAFLDFIKAAGGWGTSSGVPSNLSVDSNGWPLAMPSDSTFISVLVAAIPSNAGLAPPIEFEPSGVYVALYEGFSNIFYGFDATSFSTASPGRDIIKVTAQGNGIQILIRGVTTGGPNRISIIYSPDSTASVIGQREQMFLDGQVFDPIFISQIAMYKRYRFVDWMNVNGWSAQTDWATRPTGTQVFWNANQEAYAGGQVLGQSIPLEVCIALCNLTGRDGYFNIPQQANDSWVTNAANLIASTLNTNLKCYVQYGNEWWNPGYGDQNLYGQGQGAIMFPYTITSITLGNPTVVGWSGNGGVPGFGVYGARFTGSISGTTLTVSAVAYGTILVNFPIIGIGVATGFVQQQLSGTTGGVGTYRLSNSQTVSPQTMYCVQNENGYVAFNGVGGTTQLNGKSATVTLTLGMPGVVNWTAHGLSAGTPVQFSVSVGGWLPQSTPNQATPLGSFTPGQIYFVENPTTNSFNVSTNLVNSGGVAMDFIGSQSGTITANAANVFNVISSTSSTVTIDVDSTSFGNFTSGGTIQAYGNTWIGLSYFLQQGAHYMDLFKAAFSSNLSRLVRILDSQAAGARGITDNFLNGNNFSTVVPIVRYDALAIAPYFGYDMGPGTWTIDQIFQEILFGGLVSGGDPGGMIHQALGWVSQTQAVQVQYGATSLELIGYEMGQSVFNFANLALLAPLNRDPRMTTAYQVYLTGLKALNFTIMNHFNDISQYAGVNNWGAREHQTQLTTAKVAALMDAIACGGPSLAGPTNLIEM